MKQNTVALHFINFPTRHLLRHEKTTLRWRWPTREAGADDAQVQGQKDWWASWTTNWLNQSSKDRTKKKWDVFFLRFPRVGANLAKASPPEFTVSVISTITMSHCDRNWIPNHSSIFGQTTHTLSNHELFVPRLMCCLTLKCPGGQESEAQGY